MTNKNRIETLIEKWQAKWFELQGNIDKSLKKGEIKRALMLQSRASTLKRCIMDVYEIIINQSNQLNMEEGKVLWVTEIKAIPGASNTAEVDFESDEVRANFNPDVTTWAGPKVPGTSQEDAQRYCENNGLGYCKVIGEFIKEVLV